jgi:hydroxyethylthiazole kinase-like uncharacterized protein yjeF
MDGGPMPAGAVDRALLLGSPLPALEGSSDKDARGAVLIIAGSCEVPGAALLAATAALRVGAGKLQIATVASLAPHLALAMPEARVLALEETEKGEIDPRSVDKLIEDAGKAQAILVGPGMMEETGARALILGLIERVEGASFVLDAAVITSLRDEPGSLRACGGRLAITPHAGEMATFLGLDRDVVEKDPAAAGLRAAEAIGGVVAMKGGRTFICEPGGSLWSCEGGGVGMATSGSGDVLAGVIAGLLARGAPALLAVQWGVFLHAEAGRRLSHRIGRIGYLARELTDELPRLLGEHAL